MIDLWTKPIITYGETITPEQQAAAWQDWIRSLKWWRHRWSLEELLIQHGVSMALPRLPWDARARPADRTAGKMLQIARKAGVIRRRHGRWMLVEPDRSVWDASHSPDSNFSDTGCPPNDSAVHGPLSAQREEIK